MPIVAAAVCPHPPLLVPEIAGGAAPELDGLRAGCLAALDQLADAQPDALLVVGAGPETGIRYDADAGGDFGPYGAPGVRVGSGKPGLPLSLLVGYWLVLQSNTAGLPRTAVTIATGATPRACAQLGRELAGSADASGAVVALLVMGDGSPRRSEHSPAHLHPRAEIFDATVAAALDAADTETLAALDPNLATELQAAGRAPWQVLAGATSSGDWHGELTYNAAPYGVGYFVATWTPGPHSLQGG
ncbi:MAG TPA: class III extradiol dioxygenase subunit B-like domain-containing protein [Kribbella sp.]|nr:class III extradiol dioxygenase subunit B-like domain-containing protein [Kribbella sp.]